MSVKEEVLGGRKKAVHNLANVFNYNGNTTDQLFLYYASCDKKRKKVISEKEKETQRGLKTTCKKCLSIEESRRERMLVEKERSRVSEIIKKFEFLANLSQEDFDKYKKPYKRFNSSL